MVKYDFNKGDIVVCIVENGFGSWIKQGEIVELGGLFWTESLNRKGLDRREAIAAISAIDPTGNAGESSRGDKIFRKSTEREKLHYKSKGKGANISDFIVYGKGITNNENHLVKEDCYFVEDKFFSKEEVLKILRREENFPKEGWCKNPSKEVLKYIDAHFNFQGNITKSGDKGVAWNKNSVWPIQVSSIYFLEENSKLEEILEIDSKVPLWKPQVKFSDFMGKQSIGRRLRPYYPRRTGSSVGIKNEYAQQEAVLLKNRKVRKKLKN